MASMRGFAEFANDCGNCGRDAFDLGLVRVDAPGAQASPKKSRKLLARTIEKQIIPRLLSSRQSNTLPFIQSGYPSNIPTVEQIEEFIGLLLKHDIVVASDYVEKMCRNGASLDVIFLNLFSPAARYLGRLWEEDICDFTDVTIALSRLQQLLRELSTTFEAEAEFETLPRLRSAVLVAAPGDQHTFGVFILQEFFRRAGWDVRGGSMGSADELLGLVQTGPCDLIGLSVSNDVNVEDLASVIRAIREVASPRIPPIIVGGRFFLTNPECVAGVGADATAQDGRRAVLRVSSLLGANVLG
jgi:methanogenic corrinoid protein MtbC1